MISLQFEVMLPNAIIAKLLRSTKWYFYKMLTQLSFYIKINIRFFRLANLRLVNSQKSKYSFYHRTRLKVSGGTRAGFSSVYGFILRL